jgi:hypothetical protein
MNFIGLTVLPVRTGTGSRSRRPPAGDCALDQGLGHDNKEDDIEIPKKPGYKLKSLVFHAERGFIYFHLSFL